MNLSPRSLILLSMLAYLLGLVQHIQSQGQAPAGTRPDAYVRLDAVRPGMRGHGCLNGAAPCPRGYAVEVLRVLQHVAPGRHLVLCRLWGIDPTRQEFRSALGGSPVYSGPRLLGTVAWVHADGPDVIAGVTPFLQTPIDPEDPAAGGRPGPARIVLAQPVNVDGRDYQTVALGGPRHHAADDGRTLWLAPLDPARGTDSPGGRGLAVTRRRGGL
jgi:hypothetical protein